MPNTQLSQSKSRRDLAASLRGSRSRKHARLRYRLLQAERLEDRQLLATITGTVFNDLNANGLKDGGESGQSGWTVYLDADGNGQLGTGEISTTTAANGSYSFNGLAAGTYNVTEVQQAGWHQTYPAGTAPTIERVSLASDGTQGNGSSAGSCSTNADGRYVAFDSSASNLVPGDTNGYRDIFVYDNQMNTIERVSVASDSTQGNGDSTGALDISADGRYVAFRSVASNLVSGDTNGRDDIFVYDRQTHSIERVSLASDGTQANAGSGAFSISDDGRYVAFNSSASNLVPDDTNGKGDVFVYDRETDTIERVSLASDGTQANGSGAFRVEISDDGRYVAFDSSANNLVPGDTNGAFDVFVYDLQTHSIEQVSLAANGTQANAGSIRPSISADGRYVAFQSSASNLVSGDTNGRDDIFVYDRQTHSIERVSLASDGTQGNSTSEYTSISADGRYVAFDSAARNLVPGDTSMGSSAFVYDRQTDTIQRVSVAADGAQSNSDTYYPSISADGRYVAFSSLASTLVPGDTNAVADVFFTPNPFARELWSRSVVPGDGQTVSGIDIGNALLTTKFYVVNDASQNLTYEYTAGGELNESYSLNSGNTAPRGAASTVAGDKTWVVDANRKVYVYNNSGGLLGSWTAGTLASTATVEGIAVFGTDVWIVDAKSDKVYKYAGAATRLSGSQNAGSSFSLNSANTSPKDIVTDGVNFWVVNDSTTDSDRVFKYTLSGTLVGSWSILTNSISPTGITIDPANVSDIWIVDSGTKLISRYNRAANATSGTQYATATFALAPGNTNPQGIADPPAPSSLLTTETSVLAEPGSAETTLRSNDAALASMYEEPLKKIRIDTVRRSESRAVKSHTRDLSYTVGASANRIADNSRWARANHHQAEVDDLFAQWDSDPLELFSFPNLGM